MVPINLLFHRFILFALLPFDKHSEFAIMSNRWKHGIFVLQSIAIPCIHSQEPRLWLGIAYITQNELNPTQWILHDELNPTQWILHDEIFTYQQDSAGPSTSYSLP